MSKNIYKSNLRLFGLTLFTVILAGCFLSVSGKFRLRGDSPLPRWVALPQGMTRDQVSVTIIEYEPMFTSKSKEIFIVKDNRGKVIQKEVGYGYWHPDSARKKIPAATFPNWTIIEVNGTKEVYEQSEKNDLLKIVKKPLN